MTRDEAIEMIIKTGSGPPVGSAEHRELTAFLESSPECRELYEQQKVLWEALDMWEPVAPSEDFDRRLFAEVDGIAARGRWGRRFAASLRPSFAAALAALLIAAAGILYPQPGREPALAQDAPYLEQIDRALDDIEMLAEFDVLPLAAEDEDPS